MLQGYTGVAYSLSRTVVVTVTGTSSKGRITVPDYAIAGSATCNASLILAAPVGRS